MIEKDFILRKISLIQEELAHLEEFAPLSIDEIAKSFNTQAVIERILERVINRAIDVNQYLLRELSPSDAVASKGYRETFIGLVRLGVYPPEFAEGIAKSIGTRNRLIHEYDTIDQKQIYSSIKDCLGDFTKYCDYILKYLITIN